MSLIRLLPLVSLFHVALASINPQRYLIVSTPGKGQVKYLRIKPGGADGLETMTTLIDTGLNHPQGVAVEQKSGKLIVADPDPKKIYAYDLYSNGKGLSVGSQKVVLSNVEARWVAVDGVGNIFYTDEPANKIMKIKASEAFLGNAVPEAVYSGLSLASVSSPGGIATDNFYTYWANKAIGTQVGSMMKGSEAPDAANPLASVSALAKNSDKSYGVCIALNNVFYTQPESNIYGVKKTGSNPMLISDKLTNPRGCAFDGDGTVYVADRGANAVFSFAGNMKTLNGAQLTKAVDMEDAFGVAVFSSAFGRCAGMLWVALASLALAHV